MLLLHKILNGVWMIEESFALNYLPLVTSFLTDPKRQSSPREPENFLSIHNGSDSRNIIKELRDAPSGSIAVVSISGAITKHDQECGPDGMQSKAQIMRECFSLDNIKGMVLKIDSGGGEGTAMRLMSEAISDRNKPVVAFIDDFSCSAAYGIASGCDYIVANSEVAQVGSIGTYLTIADYEKYYEQKGIRLVEIYASLSKDKNKDYFEALNGNLEPLRKVADKFNEMFISSIEKNRDGKLTASREVWGTGKVYFAEEALKLGLIDEINSFSNTLNIIV